MAKKKYKVIQTNFIESDITLCEEGDYHSEDVHYEIHETFREAKKSMLDYYKYQIETWRTELIELRKIRKSDII